MIPLFLLNSEYIEVLTKITFVNILKTKILLYIPTVQCYIKWIDMYRSHNNKMIMINQFQVFKTIIHAYFESSMNYVY